MQLKGTCVESFSLDHESQRIHMYQSINIHRAFSMSVPEVVVCRSSVRIWDAVGLVIPNCKLK